LAARCCLAEAAIAEPLAALLVKSSQAVQYSAVLVSSVLGADSSGSVGRLMLQAMVA
jgi:hypothetical protein